MPALAVADALRARGAEVGFIGARGASASGRVREAGYAEDLIPLRGLVRRVSLRNLWALLLAAAAVAARDAPAGEAAARRGGGRGELRRRAGGARGLAHAPSRAADGGRLPPRRGQPPRGAPGATGRAGLPAAGPRRAEVRGHRPPGEPGGGRGHAHRGAAGLRDPARRHRPPRGGRQPGRPQPEHGRGRGLRRRAAAGRDARGRPGPARRDARGPGGPRRPTAATGSWDGSTTCPRPSRRPTWWCRARAGRSSSSPPSGGPRSWCPTPTPRPITRRRTPGGWRRPGRPWCCPTPSAPASACGRWWAPSWPTGGAWRPWPTRPARWAGPDAADRVAEEALGLARGGRRRRGAPRRGVAAPMSGPRPIHLVGIGGAGMSGLARLAGRRRLPRERHRPRGLAHARGAAGRRASTPARARGRRPPARRRGPGRLDGDRRRTTPSWTRPGGAACRCCTAPSCSPS